MSGLAGALRLWFWDFERGSLPYDILILLMAVLLLVVPDGCVIDPLRTPR